MRRAVALALALVFVHLSGCRSFTIGYHPVKNIRVIAVPIFDNKTLRRGYEYNLTNHLRQRILDQTPLQLGHDDTADAVLVGSIVSVSQGLVIPGLDTQPPLEGSVTISVEVSLLDRATHKLIAGADTDGDGVPDGPALITESETFVSSYNQTVDTAADFALKKLAERIVDLIEDKWGNQNR